MLSLIAKAKQHPIDNTEDRHIGTLTTLSRHRLKKSSQSLKPNRFLFTAFT